MYDYKIVNIYKIKNLNTASASRCRDVSKNFVRLPCETDIHSADLLELARCRCWAEIDLSAFKRNIRRMRRLVGHGVEILIPVKSDAYGHGIVEIVRSATEEGISFFGVSSLEEAITMREAGVSGKILFLTAPLPEQLPHFLQYEITPVLSDLETARRLGELALARRKVAAVHVEVDTGMGRTGIPWRHASRELLKFTEVEGIKLEGVMTHFSKADDTSVDFTMIQLERFQDILSELPVSLVDEICIHASNSAASLRFPKARFSMIRPGL
ncbi:MAG: alanine racemase [Candidatus Glassbacteria bacterium]